MEDNHPRKWADEQQYVAAPMEANRDEKGNIVPKVFLLWMTPDPLGAIAAMCRMYEGKPTYDLSSISDEEREHYFAQAQSTHLRAPLEAVKFHFFIEGVSRSFTHQLVRQRTAVYAQESLRFAVKEKLTDDVTAPPSIAVLPTSNPTRQMWDHHMQKTEETYNYLVSNGIPAEDARGVLPHAVATRVNYITDLRNLSDHAGNRLCTQAQFEWRIVFMEIVKAIREFRDTRFISDGWQFEALANSGLFRPVCYQLGKCPFKATFDRECTIRDRVDANAKHGIPSNEWHLEHVVTTKFMDPLPWAPAPEHSKYDPLQAQDLIPPIDAAEWLLDPSAARLTGGGGHD